MKLTTAPGSTGGQYTDGNPGGGTPATTLIAEDRNMHQMELANVVLGAGLTLDATGTDKTQVFQAVSSLIRAGNGHLTVGAASALTMTAGVSPAAANLNLGEYLYPHAVSSGDLSIIPLALPNGVTITELAAAAMVKDSDCEAVVTLERVTKAGVTAVMATVTLTGAGAPKEGTDGTISYATVDTTTYNYQLRITCYVNVGGGRAETDTKFTFASVSWTV